MTSPSQLRRRIEVKAQILSCNSCNLYLSCKAPVPFRGPTPSRIVVVGEAPGKEEDDQGKPFVGPAGRFLLGTMEEAGIDPLQVAYVNTVSCFPNGTPTQQHKKACRKNLIDQLVLLEPEYVLVLGGVALSSWWDIKISTMRSQWWRLPESSLSPPSVPAQPWAFTTWHPSYILRSGGIRSQRGREFLSDLVAFRLIAVDTQLPVPPPDICIHCGADAQVVDSDLGYCLKHAPHTVGKYGSGRIGGVTWEQEGLI